MSAQQINSHLRPALAFACATLALACPIGIAQAEPAAQEVQAAPRAGEPEPPEPTTATSHHDEWAPYEYSFTADNYLSRVTARCTMRTTTTEIATGEVIEETETYYDDEYVFTYE